MLPGRVWLPTPHGALSAGTEGSSFSSYTTVFVTPPALTRAVSINHSCCETNIACMTEAMQDTNWNSQWPIIPESSHGTVPLHHQLKWHHHHIALQRRYSLKVLPKASHTSYFPLYCKSWTWQFPFADFICDLKAVTQSNADSFNCNSLLWGICQSDFTARIMNGWTVSHKDSKAGLTAWLVFINIRLQGELLSVFWPDGQSVQRGSCFEVIHGWMVHYP